ncbi:LysR family transcriptional regulator [Verticiella sediminum]|uniref:LysR family transcriptional regulator n=1 Tax=Verticiella sediminum TaxID=1247510 RepID=A0A556AII6_9BURK|nr:LysR substrate-binding domain-containing protein [Verticiella sediminum]TSH92689.1 LysR family transcriptional regulator [Verticiella sediminum]
MVTLRQIRYFVAIAEELSFVKAAARLHVSQPPLSSQLKALEDELDVKLLTRDSRVVELTDAGRTFLNGCRRILADLQSTVQETNRTAAGELGTLRIGAVASSIISILPTIHGQLSATMPDMEIVVDHQGSREQYLSLMRGDIDIAMLHAAPNDERLEIAPLHRESLCAIMQKTHPLASAKTFSLNMLADENFVNYPRKSAPAMFDLVISTCMLAGFSPRLRHTGDFMTMVQMVGMGMGVALVPRSLAIWSNGMITARELDGAAPTIGVELAWKKDNASTLVQRAARVILDCVTPLATAKVQFPATVQRETRPARGSVRPAATGSRHPTRSR